MEPSQKIKLLDIFAGVGGLTYGFSRHRNFHIVAANEILPAMAEAYRLNHPQVPVYQRDIASFSAVDLARDFGIKSGEIDLMIGGPPCQAFSTVGKRNSDDPRAKLFFEYFRLLKEVSPTIFIFENVKGLESMDQGKLLANIMSLFESLGYHIQYKILNAADFGVPQIRERIILVGSRLRSQFIYPEPTHSPVNTDGSLFSVTKSPYLTLAEAIGDLPWIATGEASDHYRTAAQNPYQSTMRQSAPPKLSDHTAPNNNPRLIRLMEALPDGGSPSDLPVELRPTSGFKNTYSRLWWDRPAPTITRNLSTPSSSRCIHPKVARPLTTREGGAPAILSRFIPVLRFTRRP